MKQLKKTLYLLMIVFLFLAVFNIPFINASDENSDQRIIELGPFDTNGFYSQSGDSPALVYQDETGNQYLHLTYKNSNYSTFYFSIDEAVNDNGTYRLQFDARYNDDLETNNIFISLFSDYGNLSFTIAGNKDALSAISSPIDGSDFVRITYDFQVSDYYMRFYENLKIGFNTMGLEKNYLDIDNISISLSSDMVFDETRNVDDATNGDMESFVSSVYQGNSTMSIITEDQNRAIKLQNQSGRISSFQKDINSAVLDARTYLLRLSLKKSADFVGTMSFSIANALVNDINIDLSTVSSDGWVSVETEFTSGITANTTALLEVFFDNQDTNKETNYILVDNIEIVRKNRPTENIDANNNGDMESNDYFLNKAGWHCNSTYYVSNDLENSVISVDGSQVLKMYTASKTSTSITKKVGLALAKEGWYKVSFKAKGGVDFYTNNIGFRISSQLGQHVKETNINYNTINSDTWTTVEAAFYVSQDSNTAWLNFDLWYFSHNNDASHQSENNYLLIDDIVFYPLLTDVTFSDNLLTIGTIEGFNENQGARTFDVIDLTSYPYTKTIIANNALKQFNIGKQFASNNLEQNYFGTTTYDIPAEIVEEDGYYAVMLSWDGRQQTKTYSSFSYMFDMIEMSTKKYYKLSYDYKLNAADTSIARVAFIGSANYDDYMMNLYTATVGNNYTEGVNKHIYTYTVKDNGDGWMHVELIFQPNIEFKQRVTTIRFLLAANYNLENKMYVSNIELLEYSDTEYITYVEGNETNPLLWIIPCAVVLVGASISTVIIFKRKSKVR